MAKNRSLPCAEFPCLPRQHAHSSLNAESESMRQRLMQVDELPFGVSSNRLRWENHRKTIGNPLENHRKMVVSWEFMGYDLL